MRYLRLSRLPFRKIVIEVMINHDQLLLKIFKSYFEKYGSDFLDITSALDLIPINEAESISFIEFTSYRQIRLGNFDAMKICTLLHISQSIVAKHRPWPAPTGLFSIHRKETSENDLFIPGQILSDSLSKSN